MHTPVLTAVTQSTFSKDFLDLPPSDTRLHSYVTWRCYLHWSENKYQAKQMCKNWPLGLAACRVQSSLGCLHVPYRARCLLQHQVQNASL